MAIDISKILSSLGDDLVAQAGAPLGLDKDTSVRVAAALSQHIGGGKDLAIKATAADTGLTEDVISSMLNKLIDTGKEKLMNESGVTGAIDDAKAQATGAIGNIGGEATKGLMGKIGGLFGKKAG
ncbi:MAG: hypothetical protein SGJ23_10145 [Alphaproteobacteria bacterium]|nr:hypothetical protein [Alphaproteobacteria bacterium]